MGVVLSGEDGLIFFRSLTHHPQHWLLVLHLQM